MGIKTKANNRLGISLVPAGLLLMLLVSLSFAQSGYVAFGFKTDTDWISISYIVLIIISGLLGIAFGVSRIFAMRELEAWAKEEFVNLLFSVAILVLFTTFIGIIESMSSSLASDILFSETSDGSIQYWSYINSTGRWDVFSTNNPNCPYPCHIYLARGFLGSTYEKYGPTIKSTSQLLFSMKLYEALSVGSSFDLTIFDQSVGFSFGVPAFPELLMSSNMLSTVVMEYLKIITALKMQEVALVYMTSLAGLLFIIGIICRSVWFLRKFGGLLIAGGIGLYAIFPLIYVLSWYAIDRSTVMFDVVGLDIPEINFDLSSGSTFIGPIMATGMSDLVSTDYLFTDYSDTGEVLKMGLFDSLGRAYMSNTVIPIMAIFVTIGFIRQFSPMIGGDPEIAGLTRII